MQERDLLFVGGGHTHALVIRALAMRPIKGVRITLVSEHTLTPYSGMLPGYVAGHYTFDEVHIDLNRLCQWAGVRWIKGRVSDIDCTANSVLVELDNNQSTRVSYDVLSLDIGSTPDRSVSGSARYAVGVKPVSGFSRAWNSLLDDSQSHSQSQWGVIGAGAGGVELVLAMAHRLKHLHYHLIYPGKHVLPGYPQKLVEVAEHKLRATGVELHPEFRVAQVVESGLIGTREQTLNLTRSIWCTGASAAEWLSAVGLQTSERGFVAVDSYLRSVSHPNVFAAGDCADMIDNPRPKAGVYAVRQAPFLVDNLRAFFSQQKMRPVKLQSDFLSLISLGEKHAVGSRAGFVASGQWVWTLKDHIDRKFMRRLNDPGEKRKMPVADMTAQMHCAGCGSKLGPQLLEGNLSLLPVYQRAEVVPALGHAEDASLWQVPAAQTVVQSIDGFRSFSKDLWRFGAICVNHSLSDLYAMGATPVSAQVWINLAFAHPRLQKRDHLLLMSGIANALQMQQTTLSGGHSTEGLEDHVAIVANGVVTQESLWKKNTPRIGDVLVITKGLGTGVILAADMESRAPAVAVESAFTSMSQSNRQAALQLQKYNPSAVTDVTGFGLLGHLLEMMDVATQPDDTKTPGARLRLNDVPLLAGAAELSRLNIRSSLFPQLQPMLLKCDIEETVEPHVLDLMLDPQTSGGLLIAMPPQQAQQYLCEVESASIVGEVVQSDKPVSIT